MLEIIALIMLTRRIGDIVKQKNRKSGWYKFMTVLLWFGCEVIGAVIGGIIVGITGSPDAVIYLIALAGAAVGAGIAYLIAKALPPLAPEMGTPPPPPTTFG
ncbi:MAG TPA: hypothetical protein VK363_06730 [Pyrinomonadaceae bacterium]|nr:hypothetical protein [Pyrinomonadaceae bacterium]